MNIFRYRSILALAVGMFALGSAHADDELRDRYIAASQAMGENMLVVIRECAPGIDTSKIDFEFSPRMTESVGCVVEAHMDRYGRDETVALVEEAEAMGKRGFSSLQGMATLQEDYPRLSAPEMLEINQACGTIEASQDMDLSRVMRDNMADLAPCFAQ